MSETARMRELATAFITPQSNGLDLGFGGDPICPTAITVDLVNKYSNVGQCPQHLYGDATDLYWFQDNAMDYVYSSHLLEDFADTGKVLQEWARVLKPGGHMILCLPDEMKYRARCAATGQSYNQAHKCPDMSIEYMKEAIKEAGLEPIYWWGFINEYSFLIVGRKK